MSRFNLSALAVRERAITLFLIIAIALAGGLCLPQARPRRRSLVHHQGADRHGRLAGRHRAGDAGSRRRAAREADAGAALVRPRRDVHAPGLAFMTVTLKDSTPPAEVPERVLPGAQETGRRSAATCRGRARPFRQRRIFRRHLRALCAEGAGHAAAPARPRRPKRSAQRLLHVPGVKKVNILGERPERIFVEFSYPRLGDARHQRAQDIFAALQQPERHHAGRLDRHQGAAGLRASRRRL